MTAETDAGALAYPSRRRGRRTSLATPSGSTATATRMPRWMVRYAVAVAASDLLAVTVSTALYALWGSASPAFVVRTGVAVIALTGLALYVARAWEPTVLGQDSPEFSRLLRGISGAAVVVGLTSLSLEMSHGRPWVFGVLPTAGILAALGRLLLRAGLHRQRRGGHAMIRVLAVGTERSLAALIRHTRRCPSYGWLVAGVCTPAGTSDEVGGVPVVGPPQDVIELARSGRYDAVSVGHVPGWSAERLQQLAWELEDTRAELVVDPGLLENTAPRLHIANVDGLPLLRLTRPAFVGAPRLLKSVLDRCAAVLLLALLLPLLLAIALAIRLDGGPVLYRQTRLGLGGRHFTMLKFRSMVPDADRRLATLHPLNDAAGPLFKLREDPRVTGVGRVLRRYSLDELPQLFNVLTGSMSLVGPRPQLPREVRGDAFQTRRRHLVKPGMTGLWQVSGRSDLSWEDTVRLDLRYVENWTLALDAQILLRTIRAVVRGAGAY